MIYLTWQGFFFIDAEVQNFIFSFLVTPLARDKKIVAGPMDPRKSLRVKVQTKMETKSPM